MGVALPSLNSVKVSSVGEAASMASEKVASMLAAGATSVAPSAGTTLSTVGAVVSTFQERLAGVKSVLPAASIARTEKVCEPSARPA